jgi:TonB family protein
MPRDVSIPLLLWVSAAVVLHILGGGGVVGVTLVEEKARAQRAEIRAMVQEIRRELGVVTLELDVAAEPSPAPTTDATTPPPTDRDSPSDDPDAAAEPVAPPKAKPDPVEAKTKPKPEPPKPQPAVKDEPPKPEPPKPEPPKPDPVAKAEPLKPDPIAKAEPPQQLEVLRDARIAVRQIVDKDQADNPNAPRIADDANRVDEETIARIRSNDRVSKDPSPGSNARGPSESVGDSEDDRAGDSFDRAGDARRPASTDASPPDPSRSPPRDPGVARGGASDAASSPSREARAAVDASKGQLGADGPAAPNTVTGDGGWTLDPANPGGSKGSGGAGAARAARAAEAGIAAGRGGARGSSLPVLAPGLALADVETIVGDSRLREQREASGRALRAQHRGRYDSNKFRRWLPDIENYDPSVKVGNQTALNAARVPFASYLASIHNRIHPIFAGEFLSLLDGLAKGHELNQDLITHVEIVLSKEDGRVVRAGVTRNSGFTMFDAAAMEAVHRAAPYGKPPEAILSPDGQVYLHWEFHRDPVDACSTRNARPFLLKEAPAPPPLLPRRTPRTRPSPTPEGPTVPGPVLPLR